jgi:uncharacterized membrane protein
MNSETKKLLIVDLCKVFAIAVTYHLLFALHNSSTVLTENFFFELSFLLCGVIVYYLALHSYIISKLYNKL